MAPQNRAKAVGLTRRKLLTSSTSRALAVGTATLAGAGLFAARGAVFRERGRAPTPQDFWAEGDGVHDDTHAFLKLAQSGNYIRVPPGSYLITQTIALQSGQVWQFENAEILYQGDGALFEAKRVDDWALLGVARLRGAAGDAEGKQPGVGLRIDACGRFRVQDLQFSGFGTAGLLLAGDPAYMATRGARGQFSNLGFGDCSKGIDIHANAASEYNTFTNTQITGCREGIVVGAGNNQFVGGNVVDCRTGVTLVPGFNHGHGGFHGFNFTHAEKYNLAAYSIESGFTFAGCHFYGDGLRGAIYLRDSKGILIQGGQLDCAVINDGKAGKNFVIDNTVAGVNFRVMSNSGDESGVVCRGTLTFGGVDACRS